MLTTLALLNALLADPRWQLYGSVFRADADRALVAMAEGRPGFAACVDATLRLCGSGGVCHLCFAENTDGTTVCSFVCGQPGVMGGCPTPPPCPRPETRVSMEPPGSVEPED